MVTKEFFRFLSNDKRTKILCVRWIPQDREIRGVLQLVHGMQEYIERYDEFARYMADKGFVVAGHDHLGHGDSVCSLSERGYFARKNPSEVAVADMYQLTCMMKNDYPKLPYFIFGHSMGSFLLRRYLMSYSQEVDGALICGTGSTPDAVTLAGMLMCKALAAVRGDHYVSPFITKVSFLSKPYRKYDSTGQDLENSWLSKNAENIKEFMGNEKHAAVFTVNGFYMLFSTMLYVNQMRHIRRIRKDLPVLFASGEEDPVGENGKGVRRAYKQFKKAGMEDVKLRLYAGDRHEILQELDREKVFHDLYKWCKKRSQK